MRNKWFFALLAVVIMFVSGCDDDLKDPDKEIKYTGPTVENADVTTLYSDSAKVLIKLQAPVQQEFENGDSVFPKGVFIEFYSAEGAVTSTLRANYAKQERNKDLFLVRGQVVLENLEKQEKLETEELFWDKSKDRIYTEKFVKITTPERVLMGKGLETNQNFWPYKILNPTGTIELDQ